MFNQWAISPPMPLPVAPEGVNERAFALLELASRAKQLATAIADSEKASIRRRDLDAGSSRAAITTANAKWARAAEHRDRCERNLEVAITAINA